MIRLFSVFCVVVALVLGALPVTAASADDAGAYDIAPGQFRGVVLTHDHVQDASQRASSFNNLRYHGGPVMLTNTTVAVYWVPSGYTVAAGYESLINQYFTDVGADSGKTTNVYYSDTQYYQSNGAHIQYQSNFAGAIVDTNPLPANGCTDSFTAVCVTDLQMQQELSNVLAANNLTPNATTQYFMFTAKNIGSCFDSSSSQCAFSYYCAYHSSYTLNGSTVIYANMPYADTSPTNCDAGQHPNGNDADATLNVTSHEHNEAITDYAANAWYDFRGAENGDKCAWNFGTELGSTSFGKYNQVINGHFYQLQQEWSNASKGCVLKGV